MCKNPARNYLDFIYFACYVTINVKYVTFYWWILIHALHFYKLYTVYVDVRRQ